MGEAKRRAADKQKVVWELVIIRRERDAGMLLAGLAAGDVTSQKFLSALPRWIQRATRLSQPPLCLACEHEFRNETPDTFLMIYTDDARTKQVMLSGICERCCSRPEAELLKCGADGAQPMLDSEIIGFTAPSTPSTQ